jgi:nicotinamidase-related amidase
MPQKIKETALLVVDVINFCCHQECEKSLLHISFGKIRKMVPKLKDFIAEYKKKGGTVIFINCAPWTEKFLPDNIIQLYKDPHCSYYSEDKTGFSERFYGITPEKDDVVFTKNTYDAFTNPKLEKFLKKHKIKSVLIAGVFGDGCVHSTIQGGFSAGYNLVILKDLIETTDVPIRQKLQDLLKDYTWPTMFGKIIDSREISTVIK